MTINRFSRVKSPVVAEKGEMLKFLYLSILMLWQRKGMLLKRCKGGTDPLLLALPRLSRLSTPGLAYHTSTSLSQLGTAAATAQRWMSVALRCHASLEHPSSFVALSSMGRCQNYRRPAYPAYSDIGACPALHHLLLFFRVKASVAHWPESPLAYRIALSSILSLQVW
jgi:hypothetical protein